MFKADSLYMFCRKEDSPTYAQNIRELAKRCSDEYFGGDETNLNIVSAVPSDYTKWTTSVARPLTDEEWDEFINFIDEVKYY